MNKTVKVRIAVAIDPTGRWYAHGWKTHIMQGPANHDELLETVDMDECGPNERLYWVTAELPVPDVVEVDGDVLAADPQ